jgi:hypothetical protein
MINSQLSTAMLPSLNFPAIRLRADRRGNQTLVWDELRGIWLVLTPEEWVRRHLIAHLLAQGVLPQSVVQEYPVLLNGQSQRADVVVIDHRGEPLLLAECKAPDVAIDHKTLDQSVRYNSVLKARYLILTNGLKHFCYEYKDENYVALPDFPVL